MASIPLAEAQRTNPAFLASSVQTGESVFDNGGAPWPFLSQINAANYDNGGSVVAFWQPNIGLPNCPAVSPAAQAYRPTDFVDLYASTDDAVTWQVGCNLAGNYYKYQIVVPASTPGPYILNLRVANSSPSAGQTTWTALIDCTSVGSVVGQTTANNNTFVTLQIGAPTGFNVTAGQHTLELLAGGVAGVPAGEISWFQALPAGQVISSIAPVSATVDAPCADGTVLGGNLTATLNPPLPAFSGSWTVSGDSNFRLGGSGPSGSAIVCNGSVPVGTYAPTVTAHESGLADKSQVFTVTVQTGLTGTCGVGTFSNSLCPPLPSGTTQWVYIGGDELANVTPNFVSDPRWSAGTVPAGSLSSGIGCQVLGSHVSVSGGFLHLTTANPSECLIQPPPPCDARIGGAHCAGPTPGFCFDPSRTQHDYCGPLVSPGGIFMEIQIMSPTNGTPYWSYWTEGENNPPTCTSITVDGIENDITEDFGGGDAWNINYGGYGSSSCQNVAHLGSSGVNWNDGLWHTFGFTTIPNTSDPHFGMSKYVDGSLFGTFTSPPGGAPFGTGPASIGIVYFLTWGTEFASGEIDYRHFRFFRAQ